MENPWDKEPVVWARFCEEKDWEDNEQALEKYRRNKAVQVHYEWFSKGFHCGGYSYPA